MGRGAGSLTGVPAAVGFVLVAMLGSACVPGTERAAPESPRDALTTGARTSGPRGTPVQESVVRDAREAQLGLATWYGGKLAGRRTASGERFDPQAMTAAHLSLPLGTWVEVRRTDGDGRWVRVRINDRGPFGDSRRIIDLSKRAAEQLGILRQGNAEVSVEVVAGPQSEAPGR